MLEGQACAEARDGVGPETNRSGTLTFLYGVANRLFQPLDISSEDITMCLCDALACLLLHSSHGSPVFLVGEPLGYVSDLDHGLWSEATLRVCITLELCLYSSRRLLVVSD